MPDYKAMYYHLAGRMAVAIDVLEATTTSLEAASNMIKITSNALTALKEKLKLAQQTTEDMFINSEDDDEAEQFAKGEF